jgi:predicted AAA+ superfamily ATPase
MLLKRDIELTYQDQHELVVPRQGMIERQFMQGFNATGNHIEVISGIRRCGKSTLLRQLILAKPRTTAYFNFEDARVHGFEVSDFPKLDEVIGKNIDAYFFDEIQNVQDWEVFIRQMHDRNEKIFITGSNATLLSRELGTRLTGRHILHELFPFSYEEFLTFKQIGNNVESFKLFLVQGGFPEYLQSPEIEVLQNLLKDIVLRDVAIRHSIKNTGILMELCLYLLSNIGKEISFNNLRKIFSVGSTNTVSDYISGFADAYLLFFLPRFSWSAKSIFSNPRKVYAIDNGLVNANTLSYSADRGRLLENAVYRYLRQRKNHLYYFRENKECDFVVFEQKKCRQLIQVCEVLDHDTLKREVEGLKEAMKFFKMTEGYILTMNQKDSLETEGLTIKVMPVFEFITSGL